MPGLARGLLGACCPQFLAAMSFVCLFSGHSALLWCGVVPCLPCGLAYGGAIACPVIVADAVWACVMATLNLRINFRSGVWVGCSLCFAVFVVEIGFRGASWLWVGLHGGCCLALVLGVVGWWGMLCGSLVMAVQAGCLWWPLCWVGCRPDGEGLTFYLAYFFPAKPQLCNAGANCSNPDFILFYVKSCLFSL